MLDAHNFGKLIVRVARGPASADKYSPQSRVPFERSE
jgi:hypothetical protein